MQLPGKDEFPSFAPSPLPSPEKQHTLSHSVTKITIELPDSLIESTIDENSSYQNNSHSKEGQNIKVYCRFRPAKHISSLKHDHTMIDDGENRYSFDGVFGCTAPQFQVYSAVAGRHIEAFLGG